MNGLKKHWSLNNQMLGNGDKLYVECEPRERLHIKGVFTLKDGVLYDGNKQFLEIDSMYIDKLELIEE